MMDLRNWFIEKYMPMLNACATPTWYAEFKGVSYEVIAARINYQMRKKIRDNDDMEPEQTNKKINTNEAQKDSFVPLSAGIELTKDDIKQVLEQELSKTTDPEKRTALLIRVADFLSLNDSGNVEFEKPVIYLPDRMAENAL